MNSKEIIQKFKEANIYVIPALGTTEVKDSTSLIFSGDLNDYIESITKLKIDVVFLFTNIFDDDEMNAQFKFRYDDEREDIPVEDFFPEIKEYETYLGKECEFKLMAKNQIVELCYLISEPWWEELNKKEYLAFEKFYQKEAQKIDQINESFKRKKEETIRSLNKLLDDKNFINLKTQKSMHVYAKENVENLEDVLDDDELTKEIQRLSATLQARGLK